MATELFKPLGTMEFANSGSPLAGGRVYPQQNDTSAFANTYLNSSGSTVNTFANDSDGLGNYILLDANGRYPQSVFLTDSSVYPAGYKFVVRDSAKSIQFTITDVPAASPALSGDVFAAELVPWVQITSGPLVLTPANVGSAYEVDTTSAVITITLPSAASAGNGKGFIFKKTAAANIVNIAAVGTDTIDGISLRHLYAQWRELKISSNGANWRIDRVYDPVPGGCGDIRAFPYSTVPSGWLECNGAEISRNTYPRLFAKIGTASGSGNGTTTFRIPDYRGHFLRGWDHGTARDPDAASRLAPYTGAATGDNVGSYQVDAFKSHVHTLARLGSTTAGNQEPPAGSSGVITIANPTETVEATGGNETRPLNTYVMMCIKIDE